MTSFRPAAFGQRLLATTALIGAFALTTAAHAQTTNAPPPAPTVRTDVPADRPWMDTSLSAEARADLILKEMTLAEKLQLTFGYFSTDAKWSITPIKNFVFPAEGLPYSAGFVPGIERLGIPNQWETDAGVGVATQTVPEAARTADLPRGRTALPSGINTAATWNPEVAEAGGAMIGNEAFLSGFNVQLAGGMNLLREARNGRNFEYGGEDPLLSGIITGHEIKGIQSNHVISTMKHYAFNGQETNRNQMDHHIEDKAARESDLLAFQIAYETGNPGSVMCSYNRVNGFYACESDWLLNQVLKTDWGFKGYVMSDWGATHSTTQAANQGLDQQSGWAFDRSPYFAGALREAVNNGYVSEARANDMAKRILWAMFEVGLFDHPVNGDQATTIDYVKNGKISQTDAEEGMVLLKNTAGLLPLSKTAKSILIVGAHADVGVLSGGGSSQVYPKGGSPVPDEFGKGFPGPKTWYPSSPMKGIQARTQATVTYLDGKDIKAAAAAAKKADVVVVFGEQWTGEGFDMPDLNLPNNQDALISAVASKKTVVVLQTGGPVVMPWLSKVGAVIEAWYPGSNGGEAIARVLTGEVNPSGHLPATFPASLDQTPRPVIEGDPKLDADSHPMGNYNIEGAAIGYKWFDKKGLKPLFPFGHGLSYTTFAYSAVKVTPVNGAVENGVTVTADVSNTGARDGQDVAELYLTPPAFDGAPKTALRGFTRVSLKPGEHRTVSFTLSPRDLSFVTRDGVRQLTPGDYTISVGSGQPDSGAAVESAPLKISQQVGIKD